MTVESIIEAKDITKRFKAQTVLEQVSLTVKKGEICGLVGINGSGKTVLLKILCGFIFADEGSVYVNGKQIGKEIDFPEHTGVLIETPYFSPFSSGYQNLKSLASICKTVGDEEIRGAIKRVGLDPDDKKWVSRYSLGMRQRLGIAQAIMEDQDILILDEPMNGLDKQGVEDVRQLLKEMKEKGKTIVLASHYPQDIDILCDKVYEVDGGKLVLMKS